MTPKSLLRHKRCISSLKAMGNGSSFHRVLWDDADPSHRPEGASEVTKTRLVSDDKIRRVVMCSGKVYYDLLEAREEKGIDDVYLLRVEQFYPIPARSMLQEFQRFANAELVWCQEEPQNMGAWTFIQPTLDWVLTQTNADQRRPKYAGRSAAASTAAGTAAAHKAEQDALINEALA
jgi:2-oxoglutarate dehydrogenase E1 component